ncbi:hypothetical protein GE061_015890 [Apolygus lucorum]|uniref:Uncharacterized protein n=1 Tax=Apolygus lucorum TaxID=248454 RepID=A0A8S9XNF5_APOLU|nr:hypothetical protein GE061_015890 [Apolygus lucorum]
MVLIQRFSGVKCLYAESGFPPDSSSPSSAAAADYRGRLTFIWRKNRIVIEQKEFNDIYPQLRERIPFILNANKKKRIDLVVMCSTERLAMSTINSRNGVRRSLGIYLRSIPLNLIPFSRPELQTFYNILPEIHALVNKDAAEGGGGGEKVEKQDEEESCKDVELSAPPPPPPPQKEEEEEEESQGEGGGETILKKEKEDDQDQKPDFIYSPLSPDNAYDRGEVNDPSKKNASTQTSPLRSPPEQEEKKKKKKRQRNADLAATHEGGGEEDEKENFYFRLLTSGDKLDHLCASLLNSPSYQYMYDNPASNIPRKKMRYLMSPLHSQS